MAEGPSKSESRDPPDTCDPSLKRKLPYGSCYPNAFKYSDNPRLISPGKWLDDIPHIRQEAMADSAYKEELFDPGVMEASGLQELKFEQQSPTGSNRFSFSRTNSTGSVHAISYSSASSAHNTDDEDSDGTLKHLTYKDRRREAHTHAEQKRRDAIKKGYDELFGLLPPSQQTDSLGAQKLSKAAILQRSIDYMKRLKTQKTKLEADLKKVENEVMALQIMKANYEHMVKSHQSTPQAGQNQVSDEIKFHVFQEIIDRLYYSFDETVTVQTFAELSACVFNWLEEYCKPQSLNEVTMSVLSQLNTQQGGPQQ